MLVDPLIEFFFCPCLCILDKFCACCFCGYKSNRRKRLKLVEKAEEKLAEELDVVSLIKKVNFTYAMLKNLLRGD